MSFGMKTTKSTARSSNEPDASQKLTLPEKIERLKEWMEQADAIVIGAGAGLSTSAGFIYNGERFKKYFGDFIKRYHFHDMYEGGFYPFQSLEEHWAYWSRYIYINRYMNPPKPVYEKLFSLVRGRDYFVLTTNVDHCFQKAGFDKNRLYYTQGDFGLFQCSRPCHNKTYDNEEAVKNMVLSQGLQIVENGDLRPLADEASCLPMLSESALSQTVKMTIPSELVPKCPVCGKPMSMNLRADDTFVQDEGWYLHAGYYKQFLEEHKKARLLFLELGVGYNTPGIIKYPFWQMTAENPNAAYICINKGEAVIFPEIISRSVCMDADIYHVADTIAASTKKEVPYDHQHRNAD